MKRTLLVRCQAKEPRRLRPCRLRCEALEDRLVLGDALLGTALSSSWLGLELLGAAASPRLIADRTDTPSTSQGMAHPADFANPKIDRATIAYTPISIGGEQEASRDGSHRMPDHARLAKESSDLLGYRVPTPFGVDDPMTSSLWGDPVQSLATMLNSGEAKWHRHFISPADDLSLAVAASGAESPVVAAHDFAAGSGVTPPVALTAGLNKNPDAADPTHFLGALPSAPLVPTSHREEPTEVNSGPTGQILPQLGQVHALFDLGAPTGGPFPSNWFTVPDGSQNTGRRVNLPLPDPGTNLSDYQDTKVLNTLDGFNMQPRLSVPFDGPIDVQTVNSHTIFFVGLGDTLNPSEHRGEVVGINQVVWDVATNTLHAECDELLAQHSRYALIVTNGIHDTHGAPVEATEDFRDFRETVYGGYNHDLLDAIHAARRLGVREWDIVTASAFTTLSATAVQEKIRDQIHAATPAPADFLLGSDGSRTVFSLDNVTGITWNQQTQADPPGFNPVPLNLGVLRIIPGAMGTVAFGKYLSPDYEVHPGEYIPPVATRTGTPVVQGVNEIYFNLFLPSGTKPEGGWPVAIFGHGGFGNKQAQPLFVASTLAAHGIATIAINAVGHGFGPLGTLTVNQTEGESVTLLAGGRGIDQNHDQVIGSDEGFDAAPPRTIIWRRDGQRQTVADLMQLVRVIEVGMDVDGAGHRDLDPSRIYYAGQSFGGMYGTQFLAIEPSIGTGVLIGAPGPVFEAFRLDLPGRPLIDGWLAARIPSLINAPGINRLDGVAVNGPHYFNENMPLRDGIPLSVGLADGTSQVIQSPVINTVAGAIAIQQVLEDTKWVSLPGDALAYAPHLRKDPLSGMPPKSVIYMFGKGDQTAPNPTETALVRAGDLADRVTLYRNDLAFAEDPAVPKNPHQFAVNGVTNPDPLVVAIALGAQEQIATFFATGGKEIIHPEPARFFEVPILLPLPEDLNYIR